MNFTERALKNRLNRVVILLRELMELDDFKYLP